MCHWFMARNNIPRRYRMTGVQKSTVLEPVIIENHLYFHDDNNIMRYNFITSVIDIFSGQMELDKW